ncbi:uncharacterized protein LOC103697109 [Phoenix dactylifera]|uniref:Uncharacterized protein LOC103697109 n=1 Tax=Phoenix dactylifera TaxID=42345 RepID=A0A8B7BHW0_PHODC|nr:uncharacterized protein LOC103697109 [Phoenix dactylifera]
MDAMDTDTASNTRDMGEKDAGDGPAGGHRRDAHESAWNLLALARQLIDQGKPSLALQTVLAAMRSEGGEQAVFQTLNCARELYRNKMQANAAADELASLFAECVIAQAQPIRSDPPQPHAAVPSTLLDANDTSILAMTGRKQIMLEAFADGSSFVCLQCGGLVSNLRKEEHLSYWCSQLDQRYKVG